MYLKFAKKVDLWRSHHRVGVREENGKGEVIDILVGLVVVNISQCLCILNTHVVQFKYIIILFTITPQKASKIFSL